MIKEIKIENFKSIESLNLELGRLNVFIGANGSGKSNILEGIALGSCAISDKLENEFLGTRIRVTIPQLMNSAFSKETSGKPICIEFFHDTNFIGSISLKIIMENKKWVMYGDKSKLKSNHNFTNQNYKEFERLFEAYKNNPTPELSEQITQYFQIQKRDLEKKLKKTEELILILEAFLIFAPENNFLRNFNEETNIRPLGVRGEGLFNHIVEIFKEKPELFQKINEHLQLLDWFDGFEIPNDLMFTERRIKIKDRFLEDGLQYFDQRSANEGFLYLLFYLTLFISDETPKFFAIDNIDNAMNPKLGSELIKILAKLAKEHDKQTILTTHNPSVLDGLDLKDDDQRLFVIYRNADGHTKARRITSKEVPNGVESVRLSEAFIRGYIGGLPKNF